MQYCFTRSASRGECVFNNSAAEGLSVRAAVCLQGWLAGGRALGQCGRAPAHFGGRLQDLGDKVRRTTIGEEGAPMAFLTKTRLLRSPWNAVCRPAVIPQSEKQAVGYCTENVPPHFSNVKAKRYGLWLLMKTPPKPIKKR